MNKYTHVNMFVSVSILICFIGQHTMSNNIKLNNDLVSVPGNATILLMECEVSDKVGDELSQKLVSRSVDTPGTLSPD